MVLIWKSVMKFCRYDTRLATRKFSLDILNLGHMSFVLVTDRTQGNWHRRHAQEYGTRSSNCTSNDLWTCSFEIWNVLTSDTKMKNVAINRKPSQLGGCDSATQRHSCSQSPTSPNRYRQQEARAPKANRDPTGRLARGTIFTATRCHNVYSMPVEPVSSTIILNLRCRSTDKAYSCKS